MGADARTIGRANAAKIPCVMMHEHRDAYCCWTHFVNEGFIGEAGNYLLHVDHHDDYEVGLYERDLTRMPRTFSEALDFTDKELGIADFIVPALWQGMFSTFHNLKTILPASFKDRTHLLFLRNGNSLEMRRTVTPLLEERAKADPEGCRVYTYREGGLHHADRIDAASVVLDVDLDYFCWDDSLLSVPEKRVEITKEAYEDYLANRYHPLRLLPARTVRPRVVGGRCYLAFLEGVPRDPLPSDRLILRRIDRLISYLDDQGVFPKAIDVCRSSISGYLPAEKAAFVEESFMRRLSELYPLQMIELTGVSAD